MLPGMSQRGRLLLDTGAGVNLIKDGFCTDKIKLKRPHTIRLGNDKHTLNYSTTFTVHGKKTHIFYNTKRFSFIRRWDNWTKFFKTT